MTLASEVEQKGVIQRQKIGRKVPRHVRRDGGGGKELYVAEIFVSKETRAKLAVDAYLFKSQVGVGGKYFEYGKYFASRASF